MDKNSKRLVIFGDSAFSEIAYEYFTYDSEYTVAAFTVSREYITKDTLFELPIVPFEDVQKMYPPSDYQMHIALVYNGLNRNRTKFYNEAKRKGYQLANYISSSAFVWRNVQMEDNLFIFENNVIQPFVRLGGNIVLWSGNHIGHHSTIASHCFVASHVVISGFCNIGTSGFFGVNATVGNNVNIGKDCLIGAGTLVLKNIPDGTIMKGVRTDPAKMSSYQKYGIETGVATQE